MRDVPDAVSCNAASDAKTASSQISTAVDGSREFSATVSRNVKIGPQLLITVSECEAHSAVAARQTGRRLIWLLHTSPRHERAADHDRRTDDLHGVSVETKPWQLHDGACLELVSPTASTRDRDCIALAGCNRRCATDAVRFKRDEVLLDVENRYVTVTRLDGDGSSGPQLRDLRDLEEPGHGNVVRGKRPTSTPGRSSAGDDSEGAKTTSVCSEGAAVDCDMSGSSM